MTHAASHTEQELRIERYPALEREVTDPLALGLMRERPRPVLPAFL